MSFSFCILIRLKDIFRYILYRCVSKVVDYSFQNSRKYSATSFFYRKEKRIPQKYMHAVIRFEFPSDARGCCRPLSQFLVVLSNRDRRSRWSVSFRSVFPANFSIPLLSRGSWRGFTGREREREMASRIRKQRRLLRFPELL